MMDPYKILGIEKGATPEEVHRAYIRQSAKYHPDKGGDSWIFKQIQEAYEQLKNQPPHSKGGEPRTPPDIEEPPVPPKQSQPEPPFQHSANANSPRRRDSLRKPKRPLIEVVKILVGGVAGLTIGVFLLWYGFGMDVLGVMESRDERPAKPLVQNDADAQPKPALQARRMETKGTDAVASPPLHEEAPENDALAPKSLPEAPLNESGSPPDATVPPNAEPEMEDHQQTQAEHVENSASSEGTPVRSAVPPPDSLAAAEEIVRSVFAEEYASAKTPAEKSELAAKLLQVGLDTIDDIASRYVTLRSARNVAAERGDVDLAFRAVDALSESFDVDVLAEQVRLVADLSKASLLDAEATKLKSRIVELRRWAFSEDRYPLANTLNQTAKLLETATDKEWQKSIGEWASLLDAGASAFELVKESVKTLEVSPDDPDGNLTIGRYCCLLKGEWSDGLPYLEKGSDENLRAIAERGFAATATPVDTLRLADAWWDFTIDGNLADFETRNIQSWAVYLYRRALPGLSGLSKVRVEKRLQDLESLGVNAYVPTAMAPGTVTADNRLEAPTIDLAAGFALETWATGLGDIRGVTVGRGGRFGSDPFVYSVTQQAVLRIAGKNRVEIFATGFAPKHSGRILFEPDGEGGVFGGDMFVSAPADGGDNAELIYRVKPNGVSSVFHSAEKSLAKGAAFGRGTAFGDFLYVINAGDRGLWRLDSTSTGSVLGSGVSCDSWEDDMIITSGGPFGENAYITDGVQGRVLRMSATGKVTEFAAIPGAISIARGDGAFGDFLYVGCHEGTVFRVSPSAQVVPFLAGFGVHSPEGNFRGIDIAADQMWLTTDTGELLRVTPAPTASDADKESPLSEQPRGKRNPRSYPVIQGIWAEGTHSVTVTESRGQLIARCTYEHPQEGPVSWVMVGTIDETGKIEAELTHILRPKSFALTQRRMGSLQDNGTIHLEASWEEGAVRKKTVTQPVIWEPVGERTPVAGAPDEYPDVSGRWTFGKDVVSITQTGSTLVVRCTYQHETFGTVIWIQEGTIDQGGNIKAKLYHVQAPTTFAKTSDWIGRLDTDGVIRGKVAWKAGSGSKAGGHPFTWTRIREQDRSTPPPAVAPFDVEQAKAHQKVWAGYLGLPVEYTNSIGMKLVLVPQGTFNMGSDSGLPNQRPVHQVTLQKPFYLGRYEVTQEQYERVMGKNPSYFKGPQNPVEEVSWGDAVEFCHNLSAMPEERAVGRVYRLPTEAEWEHACRAGTTTEYSFASAELQLGEYGWFDSNSGSTTHPVGQKKPNAWGLYDMHGNVWEWCHDWYADYPAGPATDPTSPSSGSLRAYRSGSWRDPPAYCRSATRDSLAPRIHGNGLGFRVALSRGMAQPPEGMQVPLVSSAPNIDLAANPSWVGIGAMVSGPGFQREVSDIKVKFTEIEAENIQGVFTWTAYTPDGKVNSDTNAFSGKQTGDRVEWKGKNSSAGSFRGKTLLLSSQDPPHFSELWLIPEVEQADRPLIAGVYSLREGDATWEMTLNADGSARKSHRPDSLGRWQGTDDTILVGWTDGWRDILVREGAVWKKLAFKPGTSLAGDAINIVVGVRKLLPSAPSTSTEQ